MASIIEESGRRLKNFDDLVVVSVAVVNETPGSRREISVDQIGVEMRRMAGGRLPWEKKRETQ